MYRSQDKRPDSGKAGEYGKFQPNADIAFGIWDFGCDEVTQSQRDDDRNRRL